MQLSVYALAATQIRQYPFNRKPERVELSLVYFDTPQIVTTKRTAFELENAKKAIEDYQKQIEESDFKCSGNMLCENCEFKLFCQSD
jgi:DNA helicase-2/ATP-dependent DNA helicase PcrA